MSGAVSTPQNTSDDSFPLDDIFPMEELNISVAENDDEGALLAIATYSCAFRHPARLAHIHGMAAAAEKTGFSASFKAFRQAVQMLPNAPEPEVRSAFASQLVPLAAAWKKNGGAESHAQVVKLMYTALDTLEDDVEEVTSAGQAAVLGIARQLAPRDLRTHLLSALAGLEQHPEDEVRCILAELAANIGADIATISVEADLLPLLLRLASDSAYLVRKEVVFGLPKLAPRLSQGLVQSQLLPVYRKLAADRVWLVRAAAASTLPAIAGFLPSGEPRAALLDVWRDLASDASKWVMSSALASLAPYLTLLAPEDITDGLLQQLFKAVDEGAAGAECLVAAAEAFPALAEAAGARRWAALKPVLTALVLSGDEQVIHSLAHSLPRLARLLGPDRAASDWLPALQDLQRVGAGAAAAGLAPQLAELAALVPSEQRTGVLRPLMAALRESASWRVRADLASQLSALARCSPSEVWEELLVPAALQLCQDPVAAVRHAAAAEAAAMAAYLFSFLSSSPPAGLRGIAGAASTAAHGSASASSAGRHEASAQPPGTAAAAECAEEDRAGAASQEPRMSTGTGAEQKAPHSTHERLSGAQRDAATPGRGSVQPGEPPDQGEQRRVLAALLCRLTSELADSRSFRSRLTFVLVCHHILGFGAVQLLKQEVLPQLLRLAHDPVVNVRLALCRLLVQDKGALRGVSTAMQDSPGRTVMCTSPDSGPRLSPETHSTQPASDSSGKHPSNRGGECPGSAQGVAGKVGEASAEVSGTGPSHAADTLQQVADGQESEESNVSELSSSRVATPAATIRDASAEAQSSGCQPVASPEESEEHGEKSDTTYWAFGLPEVMHALKDLAEDGDPEINLLASIFLHQLGTA